MIRGQDSGPAPVNGDAVEAQVAVEVDIVKVQQGQEARITMSATQAFAEISALKMRVKQSERGLCSIR